MKKLKTLWNNRYFNFSLVVIFTAVVLFISLNNNLEEVLEISSQANPFWLIVLVLSALLIQVLKGLILKVLTKIYNSEYSLADGFVNAIVATLIHSITPSSSGGQVVQVYVFRRQGVKISDSLSILLLDFILYQLVLVGVGLLLLLLKLDYFLSSGSNILWLIIAGFVVDSFFVTALFVLSSSPKVYRWVTHQGFNILKKFHLLKDPQKSLEKLDETLNGFQEAWKDVRNNTWLVVEATLLNILRLLADYALPILVFLAIKIPLNWDLAFNIIAFTGFVYMINDLAPIPGAAGTTEATFILLLTPIVGYIPALSGVLIWRFVNYHMITAFGALFFLFFKKKHEKRST